MTVSRPKPLTSYFKRRIPRKDIENRGSVPLKDDDDLPRSPPKVSKVSGPSLLQLIHRPLKQKADKKIKKRCGNNLYGSKGKPKCEACRISRRSVFFA